MYRINIMEKKYAFILEKDKISTSALGLNETYSYFLPRFTHVSRWYIRMKTTMGSMENKFYRQRLLRGCTYTYDIISLFIHIKTFNTYGFNDKINVQV